MYAGADLACQSEKIDCGCIAPVGQGEGVPGGQRDALVAVSLAEACLLDQPGGAGLDASVRLRVGRRSSGSSPVAASMKGLVKKLPTLQVS